MHKPLCLAALLLFAVLVQSQPIRINQVGYYPQSPKVAAVIHPASADVFHILDFRSGKNIFSGKLSQPVSSPYSSMQTRIADFSLLKMVGEYTVVVGRDTSYPFFVKPDALHSVAVAALKSYYYQRVSEPLPEKYAGIWHRLAGHKDDSVYIHASAASASRPEGTVVSSPGGWYDAGDYNKYVVNSGITMATLMHAYEDYPNYYKTLLINIPESGNGVPDILNEVIVNLRWMLTMQDPNDGGVYHKCTNARFDGSVMPGKTKDPRYMVQKSTAATLNFVAVMAQASRIYQPFAKQFPGLADSCLHAAKLAWQWSDNNAEVLYEQDKMNELFKPEIVTGAYGDKSLNDEWFWAAVEITAATDSLQYLNNKNVNTEVAIGIPTWNKVATMGVYTALNNRKTFLGTKLNLAALDDSLSRLADVMQKGGNKAFATVMGQSERDFIWGSNSVAMNQSMLLLKAYRTTGKKKYFNAALSNMDYVLGRNATGYSFVTGVGVKSPMYIHHRPSEADNIEDPVPGFLAGGPNPGRQDKCKYEFTEIEMSYTDQECSYASNEVAINWNAPLVYVLGALEAISE